MQCIIFQRIVMWSHVAHIYQCALSCNVIKCAAVPTAVRCRAAFIDFGDFNITD